MNLDDAKVYVESLRHFGLASDMQLLKDQMYATQDITLISWEVIDGVITLNVHTTAYESFIEWVEPNWKTVGTYRVLVAWFTGYRWPDDEGSTAYRITCKSGEPADVVDESRVYDEYNTR